MIKWLFVFVVMAVLDFIWARYTNAVGEKAAHRAARLATYLVVCNGIVTIEWVTDHWLLIPTALGAYVGTFAAVKRL